MPDHSRIGPNLFLVGAPKCGTTSLYEYLRQHPQIFFPAAQGKGYWRAKEPAFFCTDLDLPPDLSIKDIRTYLKLYADAADYKWRGDASAFYLYSEIAPMRIREFSPNARILITLKPPIAQMRSWHNDFLQGSREDVTDFHEAVRLSKTRRQGIGLTPTGVAGWMDYFGVAQYWVQVERYQRVFGRENVHVLLLEDLSVKPRETYRRILEFLGVDPDFLPEFRVHNEAPSQGRLEQLLYNVHKLPFIRQVSDFVFPYPARRRLIEAVRRRKIPAPDPRDVALRERCKPDIEKLAALIGRDLSHWM